MYINGRNDYKQFTRRNMQTWLPKYSGTKYHGLPGGHTSLNMNGNGELKTKSSSKPVSVDVPWVSFQQIKCASMSWICMPSLSHSLLIICMRSWTTSDIGGRNSGSGCNINFLVNIINAKNENPVYYFIGIKKIQDQ